MTLIDKLKSLEDKKLALIDAHEYEEASKVRDEIIELTQAIHTEEKFSFLENKAKNLEEEINSLENKDYNLGQCVLSTSEVKTLLKLLKLFNSMLDSSIKNYGNDYLKQDKEKCEFMIKDFEKYLQFVIEHHKDKIDVLVAEFGEEFKTKLLD
jgi:hypothetical protein